VSFFCCLKVGVLFLLPKSERSGKWVSFFCFFCGFFCGFLFCGFLFCGFLFCGFLFCGFLFCGFLFCGFFLWLFTGPLLVTRYLSEARAELCDAEIA
jgi:hypothetical protein